MKTFLLASNAHIDRTAYVGEIELVPARLVARFGQPLPCDRYKVSGQYSYVSPAGEVFTLYDWKATTLYRSSPNDVDPMLPTPEAFWNAEEPQLLHIGGREDADVVAFKKWLKKEAG